MKTGAEDKYLELAQELRKLVIVAKKKINEFSIFVANSK